MLILGIAQQQNVVRKDRIARREIHKPAGRPDLVALEHPAIAFDGLHQGTRFALFRGAAFTVAVPDQSGL